MKATTGEAAGSGAGGGEAPETGRGALAGEGASGPVSLAGGCGHDPPGWSPAATGHAVGHRVVARPLPLPAPPARHARHAFVNNAGLDAEVTGLHVLVLREDLRGRFVDDPPLAHDVDVVGQPQSKREVLLHQEHGQALLLELPDDAPKL